MDAADRVFARRWHDALRRADPTDWDAVSDRMLRQHHGHAQATHLADIAKAVEQLQNDEAPLDVTLISARPLEKQVKESLLRKLLGTRTLAVHEQLDPSLIAGAVVRTADEEWDLSIKHQLERLKRFMVEA